MLTSVNPATGELIATYAEHTAGEITDIVERTADAQRLWEESDFAGRSEKMKAAAAILRNRKEQFARLITGEMGKPIRQSRAEVDKCARVCEHYALHAKDYLANEPIPTEATQSYIAYRPLGVVLAVMPWNFPFWQVFRFAAPALMAGNAALLKHASNVCGSAQAIESVFIEAGFPRDLFRVLKVRGEKVGEVIGNQHVKAVTLTGSVPAGRAIASKAGALLKKTVLELGGSDPYLILEDADLESAVPICVRSRTINSGQSCIAAKRFIVTSSQLDRFLELFAREMERLRMGDPTEDGVDIGPQSSERLRDELHQQVRSSIHRGARCLLGGEVPRQKGSWYPPTVLAGVKAGMPAYDEELFGPVAAVIEARDDADAVRIANDSVFGLGAAVFTRHEGRGRHIAEKLINAGCCFVNEMVVSDPRLPFGGIGDSGYGRELSYAGIREFTNIKTVYIK